MGPEISDGDIRIYQGTDTKHLTDMTINYNTSIIPSMRSMMRRRHFKPLTPEEATRRLFEDFVSGHLDQRKKKGMQAQAEEFLDRILGLLQPAQDGYVEAETH